MTGSRLAALLDQATPGPWQAYPVSDEWLAWRVVGEGNGYPDARLYGVRAADEARLIALAPDMARLLVDMAALVVDQGKFIDFDATPNLSERYGALLARFAALDEKVDGVVYGREHERGQAG